MELEIRYKLLRQAAAYFHNAPDFLLEAARAYQWKWLRRTAPEDFEEATYLWMAEREAEEEVLKDQINPS